VRLSEFKQRVEAEFGPNLQNATPANVREFLDKLQQEAWATLSGIACALAQVPLDAPSLAEPDLLDLPCYDRLGGAATLRQILASPE